MNGLSIIYSLARDIHKKTERGFIEAPKTLKLYVFD
jgi:hypothetical protein